MATTTTNSLHQRATATVNRLRAAGQNDRANRFASRAERVITRHAARIGEAIPTLYVSCDGQWLTTWMGDKVARLFVTGSARGFNRVKLVCYSAIIEGRNYYGRGLGPCMYLNLHPGKKLRVR